MDLIRKSSSESLVESNPGFNRKMGLFVEVLGVTTLAFICWKLFNLFRACCIMWVGKPPEFKSYGKWAVVTGSTDGIGKAYAQELANYGMNIVLVSRSAFKLQNTAVEIETKYKVKTKIIDIDFTGGAEIYERLKAELADVDVGVLVNNVGMSTAYPQFFLEGENKCDLLRNIINCNTSPVVFLTFLLMEKMVNKGQGIVINISSLSAASSSPLLQVYGATKIFMDSLSQALSYEYSGSGIIVQSVLPGFVSTKLSNIKRTSISVPSPTTFVRSALRTVGKLNRTAGFWFHEYQLCAVDALGSLCRRIPMWITYKMLKPIRDKAVKKLEKQS